MICRMHCKTGVSHSQHAIPFRRCVMLYSRSWAGRSTGGIDQEELILMRGPCVPGDHRVRPLVIDENVLTSPAEAASICMPRLVR